MSPRTLSTRSVHSITHRLTQRRTLSAIVTVALCAAGTLTAAPAMAYVAPVGHTVPTINYVALGDSYASGQGSEHSAADVDASSGACLRYKTAYPALFAQAKSVHINLVSMACSGATGVDVGLKQASALSAATNLVSITAGGNDAGFASVVSACVIPSAAYGPAVAIGAAANCQQAISGAQGLLGSQVFAQGAGGLYGLIKMRAPIARLVVLGYPALFGASANGASTCTDRISAYFSASVRVQLDGLAAMLNGALAAAAQATGSTFVSVQPAFARHGLCSRDSWITSNLADPASVLHPTAVGQLAYARALSAAVATLNVGVAPRFHFLNSPSIQAHLFMDYPFSLDFSAAHGSEPIVYAVTAGDLPEGLSFDAASGVISGTPTEVGTSTFTWSATNAFGTASRSYTWDVKFGEIS